MAHEEKTCLTTGDDRIVGTPDVYAALQDEAVRIVDLREEKETAGGFVPGAVWLDYACLVRRSGKAEGLLPGRKDLTQLLGRLGITPDTRVIAYDAGSGLRATRLLWTLAVCGYPGYTLMEGGMSAWLDGRFPLSGVPAQVQGTACPIHLDGSAVADLDYVNESLGRSDRCLLDVRSLGEYTGQDVRADRGGHIPGAVHLEWNSVLDEARCLKPPQVIRNALLRVGAVPEKEIIPYCQSNRRSAFMFVILKWLGYTRVRAYEGSWSEWGNSQYVPIE